MLPIKEKWSQYWPLIKSLQTGLLLLTGFTGFISARCPVLTPEAVIGLLGSLFLTISGSTVLNMVYDRDIDSKMRRTAFRPLPAGEITLKEAFIFGLLLSAGGLTWAFHLSTLYGVIISTGIFIDVAIYTLWLKRRTAWAIIWGGISGGMPILAGRVLGIGHIDLIGILLAVSILLWIPTHIMTFSMRYYDDYHRAGIPTFPSTYGYEKTRRIIALSSTGAAVAIVLGAMALGMAWGYIFLLIILSLGMLGLAGWSIVEPSDRKNFRLFKFASMYMLGAMLMMVFGNLG